MGSISNKTRKAVNNYLNRYQEHDHVLARLVIDPQPALGLVHTPREIAQQPHTWRETAKIMASHRGPLSGFLEMSGLFDTVNRAHIILTGAGTSDYVGLSLTDLLRLRFKTASNNWATTRITASPDDYITKDHRYIVVHFARSGNSPESRAVLELALNRYPVSTRHIVITCNKDGVLATQGRENSDKVYTIILPEESNDEALAMTSSFSSMVVAGQALAHLDKFDLFQNLIDRIASSAEYFVDRYADDIYDLADPEIKRAFYLGNKDLLGAAAESALKVQELTMGKLIAKAEDTLTFRHGPISAVDSDTMVCFFLSEDNFTRRYEVDVLKQYSSAFSELGARSVVVGSNHSDDFKSTSARYFSYDPDRIWRIPPHYQVNLAVLFGQLFGMSASTRMGINVDNPSIDKALYSRIVQGVRLYEP